MDDSNNKIKKTVMYGIANFKDNEIIVLKEPSDNSEIIEDKSVINPIYFDQIIKYSNQKYISYITISGIRRYSILMDNFEIKADYKFIDRDTYKWGIFKVYKKHYIDDYIKPEEKSNKKSLSTFINTLHINVQPKGICLCAQFVHWALNVAGFQFQGKFSAKLYHLEGLLNELGFHEIPRNSELKMGDIIVIVKDELKDKSDYYGHICAWDGKYWVCDVKEKTLNNMDKSHLYRYDLWDE